MAAMDIELLFLPKVIGRLSPPNAAGRSFAVQCCLSGRPPESDFLSSRNREDQTE
jgi:hypothetical protein